MNAGGNYTWPQTSLTTFYNDIQGTDASGNPTHISTNSDGSTYLKRFGSIGNVSAGYDINAFNNIHTNIRLNLGGFDPTSNTKYGFTNFVTPDSNKTYTSNSTGHNSFGGFDWNVDYTRKFKKEGEELDISGQWSHSKIVTDYMTQYSSFLPNQKDNIDGLNNEYTAQIDYTLPISKVFKLEAGGKQIVRKLSSSSQLYAPDPQDPNSFVYDGNNSSSYNYTQDVTAGYTVLTITLPKGYSILAGARDEETTIHGSPQTQTPRDSLAAVNKSYNTFIPSLTIQKPTYAYANR